MFVVKYTNNFNVSWPVGVFTTFENAEEAIKQAKIDFEEEVSDGEFEIFCFFVDAKVHLG